MNKISFFIAFLPGVVIFFAIYGLAPLDVTNLNWLPGGHDTLQAWMGWSFFQHSPWSFPLGLNPRLGMELGNSIIFTDSNPLLAFFFKAISFLLPNKFQYFGIWLFICLAMQSWFGWKLTAIYTGDEIKKFLGACLFSLSLPMIYRMSCHFNLAGHFLILAALYLCLCKQKFFRFHKTIFWALLLGASALIHAYLFIMVSILWVGDLGDRLLQKRVKMFYALGETIFITSFCAFLCWQAGYFVIGMVSSDGGFGLYRMNIWAVVDSQGSSSYVLPDLPSFAGEYEGFMYLGLGGIFLVLSALFTAISHKLPIRRIISAKWPFLLAMLTLTLIALSNNIGIFIWEVHYPIPDFIERFAQFFRASGRMFWPVFYAILICSIAIVFKYYKDRTVTLLLFLAVILQIPEVCALVKTQLIQGQNQLLAEMNTTLEDSFWKEAAKKYHHIRGYPIRASNLPRWNIFGNFALQSGMDTDIVYLSRYNVQKVAMVEQITLQKIRSGILDADTLYIVDDDTFKLAQKTIRNALLKKIDGCNVIAPGWK